MQKRVKEYLNDLKKQRKRRRDVILAVLLLAVLVVGGVAGVLERYGVAMTGTPKCGKEEHQHSDACYEERLVCGQEEVEGHTHSGTCYQMVKSSKPVCGQEETEGHIHDDACYDQTEELVCSQEETEGHIHSEKCYERQLVCGKEEHVHGEACFAEPDGEQNPDEEKEQDQKKESALEATPNEIEESETETLDEETVLFKETALELEAADVKEWEAQIPVGENGILALNLRYGDKKEHNEKPDGSKDKAHNQINGYFDLYTVNIEGDLDMGDVTVTLHFPKEYVSKDSIKITEFAQDQIAHEIHEVVENGDYYEISIDLPHYQQTGQMQYEFHLNFLGGIVPEDYELPVYATLSSGGEEDQTAENIYCPEYVKPWIIKYVNTNKYDSMSQDYTRVSAGGVEDGVIKNGEYVSFWYKLGGELYYMREYDYIVLTDLLPEYEDNNGNTRLAKFDPEANPGWTLNPDGKTVSYRIETDKSCTTKEEGEHHWCADLDLADKLENVELKLQFPGCKIEDNANDGFLKADLTNHVEADCHRYGPSEGEIANSEEFDHLEDSLIFTLTAQPVGAGFSKANSAHTIMDTKTMRHGLYQWDVVFENSESNIPLTGILLKDYSLDERLKIQNIRIETWNKENYVQQIDHIDAVTYDGETDSYGPEAFKGKAYEYGWGWYQQLELDSSKEYKEFSIVMKDDHKLEIGQRIHVGVYTTFRNPDKSHFDKKNEKNNYYVNEASVEYKVENDNTKIYYMYSGNLFKLIEADENIQIEKSILYGSNVELGKEKWWMLTVKGALDDGKDYADMRIIDLLPEPMQLPVGSDGEEKIQHGTGSEFVRKTEIIHDYKKTGRTAVIFHLNIEEVRKKLDKIDDPEKAESNSISFTYLTQVPLDSRVGSFTNEAYLLSDDFRAVSTQPWSQDIYDLDDDGDRAEKIRTAEADCLIKSVSGIYAEKFIAPADSGQWIKNRDLFLGAGDSFQYKLSVNNVTDQSHKGLVVYDVLPQIGDKSINNSQGRSSEYTVQLSDWITAPGYKVFYTDSGDVYTRPMKDILDDESFVWVSREDISLEDVKAFEIVANDGTVIGPKSRAEFVIPVKAIDELSEESYEILEKKESADLANGTVTYLKATNSFGYRVSTFPGSNLESNYVTSQIPFAGFVVQKVDGDAGKALEGAEFKLEKLQEAEGEPGVTAEGEPGAATEEGPGDVWTTVVENAGSDTNGLVSFKNLTEGTYQLTETKAPEGYTLLEDPVRVTISLDRETMVYSVVMEGNEDGHKGNSEDPFVIKNHKELNGDLRITKTLDTYNATLGGATFVFQIEAEKDGEKVYSDVVSFVFNQAGTKTIIIADKIPAGAHVTVTEIYSGASYEAIAGDRRDTIILDRDPQNPDKMAEAVFRNDYDNRLNGGTSVVNLFEYTKPEGAEENAAQAVSGTWSWRQLKDSTEEEDQTQETGGQ